MNLVFWGAMIGAVVAAVVAVKLKPAHKQFWLCVGLAAIGIGWLVDALALRLAGANWLWSRLLTVWPAVVFGLALQDAATPPSGGTAAGQLQRRAAIERMIMCITFVAVAMVVAGQIRSHWDKQAAKEAALAQPAPAVEALTVETAQFVRGVVRDQQYLEMRIRRADLDKSTPTEPGSVWQPARFISAQHPSLTVPDLHDLRAGYTLELAGTEVPKGTTGWLSLKSQLAPEAVEALKGVMARQAIGDGEEWPGYLVEPTSTQTLPFRFYRRSDGKYVRVVGAAIMCGPHGEKVIDLAVWWKDKVLFDDVSKNAIGLGGWSGQPYTGEKAPRKGGLGIF